MRKQRPRWVLPSWARASWGSSQRRSPREAVHYTGLSGSRELDGSREADSGRAKHAVLLHQRLHVIRLVPRAGLCHVRDIQDDDHIIRVLGAPEYSAIRDACRGAVLLVSVVTRAPCGVVLDLD